MAKFAHEEKTEKSKKNENSVALNVFVVCFDVLFGLLLGG